MEDFVMLLYMRHEEAHDVAEEVFNLHDRGTNYVNSILPARVSTMQYEGFRRDLAIFFDTTPTIQWIMIILPIL